MPRDFGASSDRALPWPRSHRILQAMRIQRRLPCASFALFVLVFTAPSGAAAQRDRTVVGGQVGYARSWISTTSDSLNELSDHRQGAFVELPGGVQGLLHVSEWRDERQVGRPLSVRILGLDLDRQRVSLILA